MSAKRKTKSSAGTEMIVKFWGVRGSIPAPGPQIVKYGGNTSCVSVEDGKDMIILDGGSGIRPLGNSIIKKMFSSGKPEPIEMSIFLSHVHWDHIQGIPFFKPMYFPRAVALNTIHMYGEKKARVSLEETLKGQQQYPNFPITLEEIKINGANVSFTDLVAGTTVQVGAMAVENTKLSHPDGVFCYKISSNGKSIVYATDTEHRNVLDPRLQKIAKDADILIYDAQYTPEEYAGTPPPAKFDWGHSTYDQAILAARNTLKPDGQLILFHHDPDHDDAKIDEIEKCAQDMAGSDIKVMAAREGMELKI